MASTSVLERQGVALPPVAVREVDELELRRPFAGKVPRYLCRVRPPNGAL